MKYILLFRLKTFCQEVFLREASNEDFKTQFEVDLCTLKYSFKLI